MAASWPKMCLKADIVGWASPTERSGSVGFATNHSRCYTARWAKPTLQRPNYFPHILMHRLPIPIGIDDPKPLRIGFRLGQVIRPHLLVIRHRPSLDAVLIHQVRRVFK